MSETIRTMKTDIDELTRKEPDKLIGSIAEGIEARYERGYTPPHREANTLKIVLVIFVVLLLCGAGGGGYYLYTKQNAPAARPTFELPRALVPITKTDEFRLKSGDRTGIIEELKKRQQKYGIGTFAYTPYVIGSFAEDTHLATPKDFFSTIKANPPEDFFEGLGDRWNIFTTNGNTVLAFTIKDWSRTLGGMLRWERSLASDLAPFSEGPSSSSADDFTDVLIKNNNTRIRTLSNSHAVAYVILEQKYLLIATSEAALREAIDRFIAGPIIN